MITSPLTGTHEVRGTEKEMETEKISDSKERVCIVHLVLPNLPV